MYAVAAPSALFGLIALALPVLAFAIISGLQADIATARYARAIEEPNEPEAEPPKD
jgi:hypothetical protein